MFWVAIVWSIWLAKNNLIFKGIPFVLNDIIGYIKFISWSWQTLGKKEVQLSIMVQLASCSS